MNIATTEQTSRLVANSWIAAEEWGTEALVKYAKVDEGKLK